jgi:hypothetical protein
MYSSYLKLYILPFHREDNIEKFIKTMRRNENGSKDDPTKRRSSKQGS